MKKLLFIIFILIVSCVSIGATTITVSTVNVPNANFAGTTCTLRIYASQNFVTSASQQIIGSSVGSSAVYKSVSCTKSGSTVTIPQFTIDSTTDALVNPNARYSAVIYDQSGTARINYLMNFVVPTSLGTTVSWAQLIVYNQGNTLVNPPTTYLKSTEVAALIAASETATLATEDVQNKLACYNPEHYGASGEDATDDTSIITTVIAAANSAGGGTVCFSGGTYRVTGDISLPDNVTIQGATGGTLAASGATKILLTATNKPIFIIGELREGIVVRDIELKASSTTGTSGIKFTGAFPNSAQKITITNTTFTSFDKGIYVLATDVSKNWQASYVTLEKSTFYTCTTGLWIEARNSEWHVQDTQFYPPASGDGIKCVTCGVLTLRNVYNNGPSISPVCTAEGSAPAYTPTYDAGLANSMLTVSGAHGNILIETSHNEGSKYFLVNDYEELTFPIIVSGSSINDIRLNADTYFISTGNRLYVNSVVATGASNDTRIYSRGDRVYQVGSNQQTVCNSTGTGTGFIVSGGAFVVEQTNVNANYNLMLAVGDSTLMADSDYSTSAKPLLSVGSSTSGRNLLRLGQTSSGAFANYYDLYRDGTTGYLDIVGSQSGFTGIYHNGVFQFGQVSGTAVAPSNNGRLVYDGNVFKLSENGGAYGNILISSTGFTGGALARATDTRGTFTSSVLQDNGTDIFLASGRVLLHGATASFPALKRNSTALEVRLADDSAYAPLSSGLFTSTGNIFAGSSSTIGFTSRSLISSPSDGNVLFTNAAANAFTLLQLGGTTSSFPAIKRNSAAIDFRLADDSAYAAINSGAVTSSGNVIAAAGSSVGFATRSLLTSASDGNIMLSNATLNSFSLLQFGGTTSSFPALKRNTTNIDLRLADDSAYANLSLKDLTVNQHLVGAGSAPSIAAGAGACTSPTVSISGTDVRGVISVTSGGSGCSGNATVVEVTFATAYASAPKGVLLVPANAAAAELTGAQTVYADQASSVTTKFVLKVASSGLNSATAYQWTYFVIQ